MSLARTRKQWVVLCQPEIIGLLSADEIMQGLAEGKYKDDDGVWKKGWARWKRILDIPLFAHTCPLSPGSGRPVPDIPVPDDASFRLVVTPQVSPEQFSVPRKLDGGRIIVIVSATLLGGGPGATLANSLTKRGKINADVLQDPDVLAALCGTLADS